MPRPKDSFLGDEAWDIFFSPFFFLLSRILFLLVQFVEIALILLYLCRKRVEGR